MMKTTCLSVLFAFPTLHIEIFRFCNCFRNDKCRLDGYATCAIDQVIAMQELQSIVEALLAELGEKLGSWREQNANKPIDVLFGYFNARVGPVEVKQLRTLVAWADVALAAKGTDRNRIFIEDWQVIRKCAIHIADTTETGWKNSRKSRYETGTK